MYSFFHIENLIGHVSRIVLMSELYLCDKCKDTFFVYEGEDALCSKCKSKLIPICEWCEKPESECKCEKDEIEIGVEEE